MRRFRTFVLVAIVDLILLWAGALKQTALQALVIRGVVGLAVVWLLLELVQTRRFQAWLTVGFRSPVVWKASRRPPLKPVSPPVELGWLDHEKNMHLAMGQVTRSFRPWAPSWGETPRRWRLARRS